MKPEKILYITHPIAGYPVEQQVEDVCRAGIRWVQLRMKQVEDEQIIRAGKRIRQICDNYGARFILNDKPHLVRVVQADGVHLGKEDMSPQEARQMLGDKYRIGSTVNSWQDVMALSLHAIDYLGCGPFRFTTTKEKKRLAPVLGLEGYRHMIYCMQQLQVALPLIAIGGIRQNDIIPLLNTGVQGVALSGAIHKHPGPYSKAKEIVTLVNHEYDATTTDHSR